MREMLSVLTSPTQTFERLRQANNWAWPFLTLSLVLMIALWLQSGDRASNVIVLWNELFELYPQTIVVFALRVLIVGGLLWFLNAMIQGEARYGQLCKVALFSLVPYVLIELFRGVYVQMTGDLFLANDGREIVAPNQWSFWLNAALSLGGFLWMFVLTMIGTAVMSNRPRAAVVVWLVVAWFFIFPLSVVFVIMLVS